MDKVLYIASNGANRLLHNQSIKSNNLANIRTVGFRGDLAMAKSYTLSGPVYPSRAYALSLPERTDYTPGPVESTGRPLDVAINGDGWIAVQNTAGTEAYTRAGNFQVSSTGQLTLPSGELVVGNGGPITIPPSEKILIGNDGTISVQPIGQPPSALAVVNQLKLVKPENRLMLKGDDGLFYLEGSDAQAPADLSVSVHSGALEMSNVNGVDQMVDMIALSRQFEAHLKMMQAVDEKASQTARLLQQN